MKPAVSKSVAALLALILLTALAACSSSPGGGLGLLRATSTLTPSPTPTLTPIPLAVSVNGEGVTVPEFDAELARYQKAQADLGNPVTLEAATQATMDNLVDTLLLAQGAAAQNYTADDAAVQSRIDALAAQIGGAEALTAWETAHGYTEAEFKAELGREMAAAWMRDQIAAAVPETAEQVHARQILLTSAEEAQSVWGQLKAGADFDTLAAQYDPLAHGELGWFPRGYLTEEAVEEAAFALQPGQFSEVIPAQAGYLILFVVERDPAHALSPDARLALQERALQDWLTQRRNESTILFAP